MGVVAGWASGEEANGVGAMTTTQKDGVRAAFGYIASVINVTFTEVGSGGDLELATNNQGGVSAGYATYPNQPNQTASNVYLANDQATNNNLTPGTYGWETAVHEISHALGLKHPGNYN